MWAYVLTTAAGVALGVLFMRSGSVDEPDCLGIAYECGLLAGEELYSLEALSQPPKEGMVARAYEPPQVLEIGQVQIELVHGAFAKGRFNGWWWSAEQDLMDEAHNIVRNHGTEA